jgi:hypothetical protein
LRANTFSYEATGNVVVFRYCSSFFFLLYAGGGCFDSPVSFTKDYRRALKALHGGRSAVDKLPASADGNLMTREMAENFQRAIEERARTFKLIHIVIAAHEYYGQASNPIDKDRLRRLLGVVLRGVKLPPGVA